MKHSMTAMAVTITALEAQVRALHEEVSRLRERVAVAESKKTAASPPPLDLGKISEDMRRIREQFEKERFTRAEPYRNPFETGRYFLQPQTFPPGTITC